MVLNEEIRENMIKINNLLVDKLYEILDSSEFYDKLMYFISEYINGMDIKKFNDVYEINDWLDDIEDIRMLLKYSDDVHDDLTNSYMIKEYESGNYIIREDKFLKWFKNIVWYDENIILLNKYLMKTLYSVSKVDGFDGIYYSVKLKA